MAGFDDLFGGGKKKEPPKKEEPSYDRVEHQLRGCFDPSCNICNPETAQLGLGNVPGVGRISGVFSTRPNRPQDYMIIRSNEDMERLRETLFQVGVSRGLMGEVTWNNSTISEEEKPRRPPESYNEAREEVEKYIKVVPQQSFEDIVGNEEALALLKDAIQAPVTHKELYEAYGMKMPKGALLSGPPGCGKTMFAKAAVSEMKRLYGDATEFLSLSGSEIQSPYVGVTEGEIKKLFTYAREYKEFHGHPLLIFIDEAETLLPDRTGRVRRVASWEESQVAVFLAEMDGIEECGAFVLLASNRPEVMDQAVLRDGRCDFKITIKRPTMEAIEVILRKNFEMVPIRQEPVDTLVFTALESLRDPHKIIMDANVVKVQLKEGGLNLTDIKTRHFLLEHILSGAMAASIPVRSVRHAFNRDKETGVPTGVCVMDVVSAVGDLFTENKGLDHVYAFQEFMTQFLDEVNHKDEK